MKNKKAKIKLILVAIVMVFSVAIFAGKNLKRTELNTDNFVALENTKLITSVKIGGKEVVEREEKGLYYLDAYVKNADEEQELVITKAKAENVVTVTPGYEGTLANTTLTPTKISKSKTVLTYTLDKGFVYEIAVRPNDYEHSSVIKYNLKVEESNRLVISYPDNTTNEKPKFEKGELIPCQILNSKAINLDELEELSFDIDVDSSKLLVSSIELNEELKDSKGKACFENKASSNSGRVELVSTGKCDHTLPKNSTLFSFDLTVQVNEETKVPVNLKNINSKEVKFVEDNPVEIQLTKTNSDKELKSLTVKKGSDQVSLVSTDDKSAYYAYVTAETEEIEIIATAKSTDAKVEGTGKKAIKTGENVFTVTVTAKDGSKAEYKVYITAVPKTSKPKLLTLSINDKEIKIGSGTIFTVSVPKEDKSVVIKATSNGNVDPAELTNKSGLVKPLKDGENVFEFTITSASEEVKNYKIIINRATEGTDTELVSESETEEPKSEGLQKQDKVKTVKELGNVEVTDKNGKKLTGDDKVTTGAVVKAGNKTYTVYVPGDVNGDGDIDVADVNAAYYQYRGKASLADYSKMAADVKTDGNLDLSDINKLYYFIKGKISSL